MKKQQRKLGLKKKIRSKNLCQKQDLTTVFFATLFCIGCCVVINTFVKPTDPIVIRSEKRTLTEQLELIRGHKKKTLLESPNENSLLGPETVRTITHLSIAEQRTFIQEHDLSFIEQLALLRGLHLHLQNSRGGVEFYKISYNMSKNNLQKLNQYKQAEIAYNIEYKFFDAVACKYPDAYDVFCANTMDSVLLTKSIRDNTNIETVKQQLGLFLDKGYAYRIAKKEKQEKEVIYKANPDEKNLKKFQEACFKEEEAGEIYHSIVKVRPTLKVRDDKHLEEILDRQDNLVFLDKHDATIINLKHVPDFKQETPQSLWHNLPSLTTQKNMPCLRRRHIYEVKKNLPGYEEYMQDTNMFDETPIPNYPPNTPEKKPSLLAIGEDLYFFLLEKSPITGTFLLGLASFVFFSQHIYKKYMLKNQDLIIKNNRRTYRHKNKTKQTEHRIIKYAEVVANNSFLVIQKGIAVISISYVILASYFYAILYTIYTFIMLLFLLKHFLLLFYFLYTNNNLEKSVFSACCFVANMLICSFFCICMYLLLTEVPAPIYLANLQMQDTFFTVIFPGLVLSFLVYWWFNFLEMYNHYVIFPVLYLSQGKPATILISIYKFILKIYISRIFKIIWVTSYLICIIIMPCVNLVFIYFLSFIFCHYDLTTWLYVAPLSLLAWLFRHLQFSLMLFCDDNLRYIYSQCKFIYTGSTQLQTLAGVLIAPSLIKTILKKTWDKNFTAEQLQQQWFLLVTVTKNYQHKLGFFKKLSLSLFIIKFFLLVYLVYVIFFFEDTSIQLLLCVVAQKKQKFPSKPKLEIPREKIMQQGFLPIDPKKIWGIFSLFISGLIVFFFLFCIYLLITGSPSAIYFVDLHFSDTYFKIISIGLLVIFPIHLRFFFYLIYRHYVMFPAFYYQSLFLRRNLMRLLVKTLNENKKFDLFWLTLYFLCILIYPILNILFICLFIFFDYDLYCWLYLAPLGLVALIFRFLHFKLIGFLDESFKTIDDLCDEFSYEFSDEESQKGLKAVLLKVVPNKKALAAGISENNIKKAWMQFMSVYLAYDFDCENFKKISLCLFFIRILLIVYLVAVSFFF